MLYKPSKDKVKDGEFTPFSSYCDGEYVYVILGELIIEKTKVPEGANDYQMSTNGEITFLFETKERSGE